MNPCCRQHLHKLLPIALKTLRRGTASVRHKHCPSCRGLRGVAKDLAQEGDRSADVRVRVSGNIDDDYANASNCVETARSLRPDINRWSLQTVATACPEAICVKPEPFLDWPAGSRIDSKNHLSSGCFTYMGQEGPQSRPSLKSVLGLHFQHATLNMMDLDIITWPPDLQANNGGYAR